MRLRNVPGARDTIAESEFTIKDETSWKGKWKDVFQNNHPIFFLYVNFTVNFIFSQLPF